MIMKNADIAKKDLIIGEIAPLPVPSAKAKVTVTGRVSTADT